ncbi:MAG: phosphate acetyltransferase [Pararhodobacter sp.]
MRTGESTEVTRSYTKEDMADFAALTGGALPDQVPEPLIGALFSYLLGVRLPGSGTNYLKQSLTFLAPAPLNQPLTARVEITRMRPEKYLVDLATTCRLADGTLICEGRALVLAKDVGA